MSEPIIELTLGSRYSICREAPTDIYKHVPTLYRLSSLCEHVTEFGVRGGVSTTAIVAAQPARLHCVDQNVCPVIDELRKVAGRTEITFEQGDTRKVDIQPTEMLFIDTTHTYECLRQELARHADKVVKFIAMHDTEANRAVGDDGGPGLWRAIGELLATGEWSVIEHNRDNCGFTVLERIAGPRN